MRFEKGAEVSLAENTMIQIFEGKDGELKFAVSGGNFTVDTTESSSTVKIDLGNGSVVNLEKGSRLSASNENGNNSIIIQKGTGSILTDNGEEEFITSGESIRIDESGKRSKIPVSVTNLATVQKIIVFDGRNETIDFNVKADSEVSNECINFEVSSDVDFKNIDYKLAVPSDMKVKLAAEKGTFYYRVYEDENIHEAYTGKVIVELVKQPRLISPVSGFTFQSVNVMPEINFVWDCGVYSDFCRLEIYDENDVNNPVVSQEFTGASAKITSLNEGKYFWKVVPHYSVNDVGFNDSIAVQHFSIVRDQIKLSPELSVPAMGTNITLTQDKKEILFACKSDAKNSSYRFEVSKDKNFNDKPVYSVTDESVRIAVPFSISDLPAGQYFWRVVRIDEKQKEFFSTVRDFTVSEFIPKNTELVFPPENFGVESIRLGTVQFIWKLSDSIDKLKTQSVIEISNDNDFTSNVKQIKTDGISYSGISMPEGSYFWRVKAVNVEDGTEIVKTQSRVIHVLKPLDTPDVISPAENSVLSLYTNDSVKLEWKEVTDSDYYNVKVFDSESKEMLAEYDSVKANSINVLLPSDKSISFKVQAFTEEKGNIPARASNASERKFTIESAKKIQLATPLNNSRIDGLAAIRNPVKFTWIEGSGTKNKEFVLTRFYPDGTSKVVSSVKNPSDSVSVNRLAPGSYRWTVNAVNKNGVSVAPDVSYVFTVTAVPPVSPVKIESPVNNFVVDVPYLRNNRNIIFSWKAISGVTDYDFVLYQKNSNGTLRRIINENIKSPSYTLSDLRVLDVGKFEWHVTAYVHAADGFEIQKSPVVISEFEVNFDLPDTVKTIDPGRMYAE